MVCTACKVSDTCIKGIACTKCTVCTKYTHLALCSPGTSLPGYKCMSVCRTPCGACIVYLSVLSVLSVLSGPDILTLHSVHQEPFSLVINAGLHVVPVLYVLSVLSVLSGPDTLTLHSVHQEPFSLVLNACLCVGLHVVPVLYVLPVLSVLSAPDILTLHSVHQEPLSLVVNAYVGVLLVVHLVNGLVVLLVVLDPLLEVLHCLLLVRVLVVWTVDFHLLQHTIIQKLYCLKFYCMNSINCRGTFGIYKKYSHTIHINCQIVG